MRPIRMQLARIARTNVKIMFRIVIQPSNENAKRLMGLGKDEFAGLLASAAAAAKEVLGMPADEDGIPSGWTIDIQHRGAGPRTLQ